MVHINVKTFTLSPYILYIKRYYYKHNLSIKKKRISSFVNYLPTRENYFFPFPEGVIRCWHYCTKSTHNKLCTSLVKLMYIANPCEEDCIFKLKCVFIQDVCSMKQCRVERIITAWANNELVCHHLILNRRFV